MESRGVQRSTKEEQTATVLLDLTRLSVWLHYYYNIYMIDKKDIKVQGFSPPTLPSLQLKLAGRVVVVVVVV